MELAAHARAVAVDKQATIEAWVADYGESVLRLAYLYLKDRHLAEDAFQDVFTRAYLNLDRFRGESSPRTWLYRITANLCKDRLDSWSARRVLVLGQDLVDAALGSRAYTEDGAFDAVDAEALMSAVLRLPIEFREVVVLVYYEDLSLQEAAEALGLPHGTVRSRLYRARQKLRDLLAEVGWEA